MDLSNAWLHPFWAFALPIAASVPLGWLMFRSLDVPEERTGKGFDALPMALCRLMGRRAPAKMSWKQYAIAFLFYNAALFVATFVLLYIQQHLPINPDGKGSLGALGYKDTAGVDHPGADTAVVFNTVCSFVTNTNLQHYSGEQHLSYFSQLAAIVWLMFVTPAAGLAVMLATLRGLRGDSHMGDFYVDLIRSVTVVFIPVALVAAVLLVGMGVPMTFQPAVQAKTLDGAATKFETQTICRGPVAALVAIKQAGTNGGGFFGPNTTHPYENPTPWSNLLAIAAIVMVPMASIVMAGHMLRDMKHATVIYGVMLTFLLAGCPWLRFERRSSRATGDEEDPGDGRNRPEHGRDRGPIRAGGFGDLGGHHHGHVKRLREQHARQPEPHRRHGSDDDDDAQRRLQRHRRGL